MSSCSDCCDVLGGLSEVSDAPYVRSRQLDAPLTITFLLASGSQLMALAAQVWAAKANSLNMRAQLRNSKLAHLLSLQSESRHEDQTGHRCAVSPLVLPLAAREAFPPSVLDPSSQLEQAVASEHSKRREYYWSIRQVKDRMHYLLNNRSHPA